MSAYLIVALGAGLGGALRHGINVGAAHLFGTGWPYGTFAINVVGSLAMGVLAGYFALRGHASQGVILFLTTGVLGGFTTFSTYVVETTHLLREDRFGTAVAYLAGRRCDLAACLLEPPGPYEAGELIPDEVVIERVWPDGTTARSAVGVLLHRLRRDLVHAGLDGAALVVRAEGGGATKFAVPPGASVVVE